MRTKTWLIVVGGLVLWGLEVGSATAEILYFAQGGEVQLPATIDGNRVRLEAPGGPIEFDRGDFRKIVPGAWPEREWAARRRAALAGDAGARFAAAWWALENGLAPQAESMLRQAHKDDPRSQPAAAIIAQLDRLAEPCPDPDLDMLRAALGEGFEMARGPHVVLFHQHGADEAAERIEALERVTRSYYMVLSAQGVELPPPRRRLASAWFAEKKAYQSFLRAQSAGTFLSTGGYYHPTLNLVATYDARSDDAFETSRAAIAAKRRDLDRPGLPNPSKSRAALERRRRELDRRQLLLDLDRRAIDLGTAAHEMVHQLVATSGLTPRHDAFPTWLHEGFAAQFEVVRGGRWAGISRAHDLRLPDWRKITPPPRLNSILRDDGFGWGYQRDLYAQSWALVYFLRKHHPQQFQMFIDLLRAPNHDPDFGPSRNARIFRQAFGTDGVALEREWRRCLDDLKTPTENSAETVREPSKSQPDRD